LSSTRPRIDEDIGEILCVCVSIKCAMFVVSDVLTSTLPSGLRPIPSGSTPTGISATCLRVVTSMAVTIVILVRNIKEPAVGTQDQQLGIRSRRQSASDGKCPSIENLNEIILASTDVKLAAVFVQDDPARTMSNRHGFRNLQFIGVDKA